MKELGRSIFFFILLTILTGFAYPLFITAVSHWCFPRQSGGSLVMKGTETVGSSLIGQQFTAPQYFHGRPSASDYDAVNSGGVNLGPDSRKLIADVKNRVTGIRKENNLPSAAAIPADLVSASASGLDPHISLKGAIIQARRVALSRGLAEDDLKALIDRMSEGRGFFGPPRVDVLEINMVLDAQKTR